MHKVRFGVIGAGYMGKAYAIALSGVATVYESDTRACKEMIAGGELGEIICFSGTHDEDFLMDPDSPHSWRLEAAQVGRAGVMGDVASHLVNLAQFLCGPIAEVVADTRIVLPLRPAPGGPRTVENDDQGNMLCRFASGVMGNLHGSRVQAGRKMGLTCEVVGTKGSAFFDQDRPGELHYHDARDPAGRRGFRRLLTEPGHGDDGHFCVGAAHGYGYHDMIVGEMAALIRAIATATPPWPDFAAGYEAACVLDAMLRSVDERRRVAVDEIRETLS